MACGMSQYRYRYRVVVMVQWLAHPTSNQGDAGSIPSSYFTVSSLVRFLFSRCVKETRCARSFVLHKKKSTPSPTVPKPIHIHTHIVQDVNNGFHF